jgi:hypothetical protein
MSRWLTVSDIVHNAESGPTLLDTLEESVVTGSTTTGSLFVGVMSKHLPSVY